MATAACGRAGQIRQWTHNRTWLGQMINSVGSMHYGWTDTSNNLNQFSRFFQDVKFLLLNKVYVVNVLGYTAYTFFIGAYSYWGPKAGKNIYNMSNAGLIFGGVTIVCGILGTIAGGYALDFMTSTISNSFKLLSTTTLIGALFCFGAFCFKSMYGFLSLFSIGELLIFGIQVFILPKQKSLPYIASCSS